VGTLPVLQPSPGTVILNLPAASSSFGNQVVGSLVGEEFFYQGPLTLLTSSGSFTLQGTINGTIEADGDMNLGFSFALGDLCRIPGTIVGTKN
jgi:cytoskeletal protein CcmA (bactofilin family)